MSDLVLQLNERQQKVIGFALYRFISDCHEFANIAAQDKSGIRFKPGAAESFLRDAKDAAELRAIIKGGQHG